VHLGQIDAAGPRHDPATDGSLDGVQQRHGPYVTGDGREDAERRTTPSCATWRASSALTRGRCA
jgi:hypothetical protein